jgi:hypothetical protein
VILGLGALLASMRMLRLEARATREDLDAMVKRQNHLESSQRDLVEKLDSAVCSNKAATIMAEVAVHTAQRAEEKVLADRPAEKKPE